MTRSKKIELAATRDIPFNKLILSRARLDAGEALALSQGE